MSSLCDDGDDSDTSQVSEEFHISFSSGPFFGETSAEPVVCIFGWSNCRDGDLIKFSDMYKSAGCTTLRTCHSTNELLSASGNESIRQRASKLVDNLIELDLHHHPIYFHSFGFGGLFNYTAFIEQLQQRHDIWSNVRGAIFDSCPGRYTLLSAVKMLNWSLGFGGVFAFFYLLVCHISFSWHRLVSFLLKPSPAAFFPTVVDKFAQTPTRFPELYLHSTADEICPWQHVDQLLKKRATGRQVLSECFHKSNHIKHFDLYPDQYRSRCVEFLTLSTADDDHSS